MQVNQALILHVGPHYPPLICSRVCSYLLLILSYFIFKRKKYEPCCLPFSINSYLLFLSISSFLSPFPNLPLPFLPSSPLVPCVFVSSSDYFSLYIFGLCFHFIFHTYFVLPGETHGNTSHLVDRVCALFNTDTAKLYVLHNPT